MNIAKICSNLRAGADILAMQTAKQKNHALETVWNSIDKHRVEILDANTRDIKKAQKDGMPKPLIERLTLDENGINSMLASMKTVISQSDPVGEETAGWTTPNGLQIRQIRVPIGVAAIIYESRPNVTVDAFCLAYKSGNAILLRGSASALESNRILVSAIKEGLTADTDGVPNALELAESTDHSDVEQILTATGLIDVVLPRGSAKLIRMVTEKARIPVIQTGNGICHLYVDASADLRMATAIAENAKIQRPGACNAIETILVNRRIAGDFLPLLEQRFAGRIQMRADETCYQILKAAAKTDMTATQCKTWGEHVQDCVVHAKEDDFGYEFLDYICAIKAVDSTEDAIAFINTHNTKHSECIVTNDRSNARLFQAKIDAACIYVNASTRFTDGGEFGFGAELGISTQKLHARGPMGIRALTTTKFLIDGEGQIR